MNNNPKKPFTREDLQQPPGATVNQNSDGTAKSERQIKWEQSLVDLANSLLPKPPVKSQEEDDDD
jgi:hypothetical protein